jgi:3-oxoadipyl-CoA thiolase
MAEAFICEFVRSPIGRYEGGLARVRTDDLAAHAIRSLIAKHPNIAAAIEEVYFGCANQAGEDNRNVARMAALLAGLPDSTPGITLNRLCSSGLDAVAAAARAIKTGEAELVIGGGVESMTRAPFVMGKAEKAFQRTTEVFDTTIGWRFVNARMKELYGTDSMPETGEYVAKDFKISREDQDAFALRSQQRAAKAQKEGFFARHISAVSIPGAKGSPPTVFDKDEQIRADSTLDTLAKLKPVVKADGTVTAGNASSINDGSAALLLASESAVKQYALMPLARVVGFASAGVQPRIMGVGPVPAVQKVLARYHLSISDLAVIELNEAFASQALASLRELKLADDAEHVNPHGGAIALGHPLGMSGARIAGSAVQELNDRKGRYALASMCVGVGQGAALLLERV